MARYYCEYCHSYLTHDTLSVRKSHLIGKNHLRIVADYYRNKGRDETNAGAFGKKKRHGSGNNDTTANIPIRCMTNREKKTSNKLSRIHRKELRNDGESVKLLSRMYEGSPGYSKVFIDGNRLDIGDLVRSAKLPQRANANDALSSQPIRTRNEVFQQRSLINDPFVLEPPRVLTQWSNTVPKTAFYHDNRLLRTVITESRKRIGAVPTSTTTKRRKF